MLFKISIFFIFTNGIATYNEMRPRVIDGEDAKVYPFVVSIVCVKYCHLLLKEVIPFIDEQVTTCRTCSGSLITENWVLSASHCIGANFNKKIEEVIVRYGDLTVPYENSTYTYLIKGFVHPKYRHTKLEISNDVGLAKVERVSIETYGKLSSVDYQSLIGRSVQYIGSGMSMSDAVFSDDPAKAREILITDQVRPFQLGHAIVVRCDHLEDNNYSNPYICLRPKCSRLLQRAQRADSGGPLLYRGKIIGVANAITDMGTVRYTVVHIYHDWIKNIISTE
ncbi:chymotrypsin-2-like [Pectinophora gossypiella]|uniref:chymotrypsin-2-like n=1 Tax=Pectinophora gossypiella TaxID=13191 RepID=UPI00214EE3EE|nr:chymotrypsin-2-like [Pectinophora gossypiella]